MPLEDLDLVFEDEEDQKKKKSDIVHSDVDLEFGASEVAKPQPSASVKPQTAPASAPARAAPSAAAPGAMDDAEEVQPGSASVKRLEEVGAKLAAKSPSAAAPVNAAPKVQKTQTAIHGTSALKLTPEPEDDALAEMQRQLEETKFEGRVKVAVMEEKIEFITDVLSDAKLMQHQRAQLLARMNQKHPDLKPELLALQKLLADFIAKKRK